MNFDHVLVIGFGGPARPEEVRPFIQEVTRGLNIPEARLREVEHHYEMIGGVSPYNQLTFRLAHQLEKDLRQSRFLAPVFVGMRNERPFLKETLTEIKKQGLKKGVGVILAPHRSEVSFERYLKNVEEAKRSAGAEAIEYEYLPSWHAHPLFIQAQAELVGTIYESLSLEEKSTTHLLFSAHSIPLAMAESSRYVEEIEESSARTARAIRSGLLDRAADRRLYRLAQANRQGLLDRAADRRLYRLAQALQVSRWSIAYQSRSGSPREPWLEPDVLSVIRGLKGTVPKREGDYPLTVLLVPIGFLCDNAEVLYDLDIEARGEAEKAGIRYLRAPTVGDHPKFTALLTELIGELFDHDR